MSDQDPFSCLTAGDQAMPDGDALTRLGSLLRDEAAAPKPVDLRARIQATIQAEESDDAAIAADSDDNSSPCTTAEEDAIDAWYNGDRAGAVAADPLLELGALIREGAQPTPRPFTQGERPPSTTQVKSSASGGARSR